MEENIEIGQIVNTYGIKGYLKIVAFTDDIKRFDSLKKIYINIKGNLQEEIIEDVKYHKNLVLLKLKNYDDINQVEKFKGNYIFISKEDRLELPEDSYFITDIIGLDAFTMEDKFLGKIVDVFSTKSNDVYVVRTEQGKDMLLPAIEEVVKQIDLDNKKIIVNQIKGLE